MTDHECVEFLQWALPEQGYRWQGFRKVRRQVCKRLRRRLEELEIPNLPAYKKHLMANPDEWQAFDSLLYISISRFYRDRKIFDLLKDDILPALAARALDEEREEVICWSAGCCSGEEAYTLKIVWEHSVLPQLEAELRLRVIASDRISSLLERARKGIYSAGSMKDLPEEYLSQAFSRIDGGYALKDHLQTGVEFLQQDIRNESPDHMFDLILCRNLVFTYFDEDLQRSVLERMTGHLKDEGFLAIGSQEHIPTGFGHLVQYRDKGIYRKTTAGNVD